MVYFSIIKSYTSLIYRRQQEERLREYEEKERQRQLMKQKKQGLNQLWLSGKSLVTVEDDSDVNDEDLLPQYQQEPQQQQLQPKTVSQPEKVRGVQIKHNQKKCDVLRQVK